MNDPSGMALIWVRSFQQEIKAIGDDYLRHGYPAHVVRQAIIEFNGYGVQEELDRRDELAERRGAEKAVAQIRAQLEFFKLELGGGDET